MGARKTFVGTAWAPGHGGVQSVEVSVDARPWRATQVAANLGPFPDGTTGHHTLRVRVFA